MQQISAILSLGSNIAPKSLFIDKALSYLQGEETLQISAVSNFYQTTPVNCTSQESFINAVCEVKTFLPPLELFKKMEKIECLLGKTKKLKTDPRKIDLDLLFFSDQSYSYPNLTVPHPRWQERLFVLIPLLDITKQILITQDGQRKVFDLENLIKNFSNFHNEKVVLYEYRDCKKL